MGKTLKVKIPSGPVYIVLFLLLAFLCYEAHQLVRHIVGAWLCGGFGTMTFTVTTTRESCSLPTLITLSGPVLTYGLAWLGMFLLRLTKYKLFSYALIFASFAHLRFIQTLSGGGDELTLAKQWFGVTSRPIVAAIVFIIDLPPLITAFRVIANKRRALVFICSWLLPLPLLFGLLIGNNLIFGTGGSEGPDSSFLGVSLIVLIGNLIAGALLILLGYSYLHHE